MVQKRRHLGRHHTQKGVHTDVGAWADHLSKIARLSFYACAGVCVGVCPCSVLARACAVQPIYIFPLVKKLQRKYTDYS